MTNSFLSGMVIDNGLAHPEIVYPIREHDYAKRKELRSCSSMTV